MPLRVPALPGLLARPVYVYAVCVGDVPGVIGCGGVLDPSRHGGPFFLLDIPGDSEVRGIQPM